MTKLDGKVAVVTGAFSGIGEATAEALAAEEAAVAVAARREDRLTDLVGRIRGNGGACSPPSATLPMKARRTF